MSLNKPTAERRAQALANGEVKHGTATGYQYWGCRCAECTRSATERTRAYLKSRTPEMAKTHGTASTYVNYHCRCDLCKAAASLAAQARKARQK